VALNYQLCLRHPQAGRVETVWAAYDPEGWLLKAAPGSPRMGTGARSP